MSSSSYGDDGADVGATTCTSVREGKGFGMGADEVALTGFVGRREYTGWRIG